VLCHVDVCSADAKTEFIDITTEWALPSLYCYRGARGELLEPHYAAGHEPPELFARGIDRASVLPNSIPHRWLNTGTNLIWRERSVTPHPDREGSYLLTAGRGKQSEARAQWLAKVKGHLYTHKHTHALTRPLPACYRIRFQRI
jgi:hypothetical protein